MKSIAMRIQMFFIAATVNLAVCISQSLLIWLENKAQTHGININSAFVNIAYINYYLIAIAVVCALGCIGILLTGVFRHRKELAVRIATGATSRDIFNLVVVRWTLRTAVVPMLLGFIVSTLAILMPVSQSTIGIPLLFSPLMAVVSLLGMVFFCLLVSLYPALRAMRLNVIEALATE